MMQNLSGRIIFQEKFEFLKSASGFNFTLYQAKVQFLTHTVVTFYHGTTPCDKTSVTGLQS